MEPALKRRIGAGLLTAYGVGVMVGALVIIGAVALPVASLAKATAAVLLVVFLLVNLSLIALKRREPEAPFRVPVWVPWFGVAASLAALFAEYGGLL